VTHNGVRHEHQRKPGAPTPAADARSALHQRAMANGFGNAMGTATELALLPGVFGFLGWLLDGWLGTEPLFVVTFLVFAFAGMLVRAWVGYDKDMRAQEAGLYTRIGRRGHEGKAL
jgi:F0F1-type ATP synthase assembly protein I